MVVGVFGDQRGNLGNILDWGSEGCGGNHDVGFREGGSSFEH